MLHGYYLASLDALYGDAEMHDGLRERWASLGINQASRYCGVSRWTQPDGSSITRVVAVDFFKDKPMSFAIVDRFGDAPRGAGA